MTLGQIIKKYRNENKLSMDDFAYKSGLSKGYISMLERNKNPKTGKEIVPSLETIKSVSTAIGKDFNEVFNLLDDQDISLISNEKLNLNNSQIMAKNIQYYMDLYNKSRKDICEAIGVKYTTFTDWVKGNSYPRIDKIEMMANYFGIEKSDLIEEKETKDNSTNLFTNEEILHLEKYRQLDAYGKETIDYLLNRELGRYDQFKQQQDDQRQESELHASVNRVSESSEDYGDNVTMMPTFMQKICAGTGSIGDDIQLEDEPYPAIRVPKGAEYAATISGDSMEPEYFDGDVVFFSGNSCVDFGDIVVLNINEENYMKKYTKDGFEALNPKYDILVPADGDHVVIYGKVLGKL